MQQPQPKEVLYWCPVCNLPLIGKKCRCGIDGRPIVLEKPHDVRPALARDREHLIELLSDRFGCSDLPRVVLLAKLGGVDRNETIIANGVKFGRIAFDPHSRTYSLDLSVEALPYLLGRVTQGVIDITEALRETGGRRVGGKKITVRSRLSDGCVILQAGSRHGVGTLREGAVRVRQLARVEPAEFPDPGWDDVVAANRQHLKNIERHAIRFIRSHMHDRPAVNVSFSGGKDSTAVLELARRAGVTDAYFVDTGMDFPETLAFVKETGIETVLSGGDFYGGMKRLGLPRKDNRWCCEELKLKPVRLWLEKNGPCVTVQGNRRYESYGRLNLPPVAANPFSPAQLNISPILNWRALEVFLYIWWRGLSCNPLYDRGFERVGCWNCPAMLEAEFEEVKRLHPELHESWMKVLLSWAKKQGLSPRYIRCGMWRWEELPPKMLELARENGIPTP